jgi:hypothetical protein
MAQTLGIFGDSYAAINHRVHHTGWSQYLQDLTPYKITNYAVSGSSLYHAWKQFNQFQSSCDRLILVVTHWARQYIENLDDGSNPLAHISSINHLEYHLKNPTNPVPVRKQLLNLYNYWIHIGNEQQRRDYHALMLKDIIEKRPDALVLSAIPETESLYMHPDQVDINSIGEIDINYYLKNNTTDWWKTYDCRRQNHMNNVNNQLFASCMNVWLQTNQLEMKSVEWGPDTEHPFEYYFEKSLDWRIR